MANTLYDNARELFLTAGLHWTSDTFKAILVDSTYVLSASTHQHLDDVSASAIVSTSPVALTTSTSGTGAADSTDITFPSVSGDPVTAIIIFQDTGVGSTSPLVAYLDTATGLPITPNGGDIIVTWDNGVNKIFRL